MHEHAARTTGWIEDRAMIGLDHLNNQLHDRGWREVFAALLHEGRGELSHEILEDEPIGVAFDLQRREETQQLRQYLVRQARVALRQRSREVGVRFRDALHGSVK